MHTITRRRFLEFSGVAAARALAGGATVVGLPELLSADAMPADVPVLVLVTLYGGNDGLNTVVPAADRAYQDGRPELAYAPGEVLDLGNGLGLNPGLTRLHQVWGTGRLAIVRGVGYPKPDHSHFRSMAIWQTASPDTSVATGWLGRWLDATGHDPVRAVSLEPVVPPFLVGERTAAATVRPEGLRLPDKAVGAALRGLGKPAPGEPDMAARVAGSIAGLHAVAAAVNGALTAPPAGTGALAAQLTAIGALIQAGVPTRVYSTSLGGFDTHADERGTQQRLLGELDGALGGFLDGLAGTARPVVVAVYSEFGRRVRANASQGTDHGTAAPLFVIGDRVRGGFHGAQPSLADLDNGDLKFTTDFRDVYATLLEDVLGVEAGSVLGDWRGRVGLFG